MNARFPVAELLLISGAFGVRRGGGGGGLTPPTLLSALEACNGGPSHTEPEQGFALAW